MLHCILTFSPALSSPLPPKKNSHLESNSLSLRADQYTLGRNFLFKVLSSTNLHDEKENRLLLLYQFLSKRPLLNAGGRILPYLIYFYNWIHDKWSYTITKKQAKETMIGKYLQVFLEEHFPNSKDGLLNWFKNFLGELN